MVFFAGWDFTEADLNGDYVSKGYRRGVPMGGDLATAVDGQIPAIGSSRISSG
jgi:hypothetical protein